MTGYLTHLNMLALKVTASAALLCLAPVVAGAAETSQPACQPTLQQTRTDFPQESQQLGEHGTVQLQVHLSSDGRAIAAAVGQSSGFAALDRAAADSVRKYWRFDVSHCGAAQLQSSYAVDVRFERATGYTLSNTINWAAIAKSKKLTDSNRCQVVEASSGTKVFSCIPSEATSAVERDAKLAN